MELNIKLWAVIALLGSVQGIILSYFVFTSGKKKNDANIVLSILILIFSLRLAEFTAYWTPFFKNYPHLSFITSSFPFLYGALLFLYVKKRTNKNL